MSGEGGARAAWAGEVDDFLRVVCPRRRGEAERYLVPSALPEREVQGFVQGMRDRLEREHGAPGWFRGARVNFRSRSFDARLALYDPHVVPPCARAAPLDRLSACAILLPAHSLPASQRLQLAKRLALEDSGLRAAERSVEKSLVARAQAAERGGGPF
jgi:hypothetical protein